MQPNEEEKVEKNQTASNSLPKIILMKDGSDFSKEVSKFSEKLIDLAPNIQLKRETAGTGENPGLYFGSALSCHFIPTGQKLETLMNALSFWEPSQSSKLKKKYKDFSELELPADLRLYVAEGCPHCPKTFEQLIPLPFVNPQIHLAIFDPLYFPQMAEKDTIRSVPTTLLDQNFRWSGAIDLKELAKVITTRDPSNLNVNSLDMLLKDGKAMSLVEMFQKSQKIFPAFLELLAHPIWSTRLGAMVVMEALIEGDRDLALQIQDPAWEIFSSAAEPVQGDLLYILGELKSKDNIPKFNQILNSDYSTDIKDAANEALSKMSDI